MNENNTFGLSDAPDHELPMPTTDQATRLRALVVPYAQEGHTCALHNLAELLRGVHARLVPTDSLTPEMIAGRFSGAAMSCQDLRATAPYMAMARSSMPSCSGPGRHL